MQLGDPRAVARKAAQGDPLERLEKLQRVTDAALAHLSLDELLDELLTRIREVLDADTAAFLMLDEDAGELVARAAKGLEAEVELGVRIPVGGGFAGRIATTRRPVVSEDVDHYSVLNPILRERKVKSLLGAPLLANDRVIGVVHVGTVQPRRFREDEIELLQLAAERAALAIEHGRLYEAERAGKARLEKLQRVTDAALAHLSLDELLDELLTRIREVLDADTAAFLMLDEDGDELVARAAKGLEEEVELGVRIPVGRGFAGRIAATRRPLTIEDVDRSYVLNPILREKRIKSLLGAPLLAHDRVIGVIHVGTLKPRRFEHEDVELLQLAADRAAVAIERAMLQGDLLRLDRLRHRFVSIASHELRTPAASVYGAIKTLEARGAALGREQQRAIRRMLSEESERLVRLIDQLLDVSRIDAHAVEIRPERLRVRERVESVTAGLVGGGTISIQVPKDLVTEADPSVFDRIVSNLLINALRHGAPPIEVSARRSDNHFRLAVVDHGPGVPADFQSRLFEEFTRAARGDSRVGSGLGLAIARSYAQVHGGDILYADVEPSGARFELVLPLAAGAPHRGVGTPPPRVGERP